MQSFKLKVKFFCGWMNRSWSMIFHIFLIIACLSRKIWFLFLNRCEKLVCLLLEALAIPFFTSKLDLDLKNTICQLLMTWKIYSMDFRHQNSQNPNFQVQIEVLEIPWKQFVKAKKTHPQNSILCIVLTQKPQSEANSKSSKTLD